MDNSKYIAILNRITNNSFNEIKRITDNLSNPDVLKRLSCNIEYSRTEDIDYSYDVAENDHFYICRYAHAYAFEYAMMYEIVLRSVLNSGSSFHGLLSLGCGSLIDALSLGYSAEKLSELYKGHSFSLNYCGVDCDDWSVKFLPEGNISSPKFPYFNHISFFNKDIADFISENTEGMKYSIISFPKILNEIDYEYVKDSLVPAIRKTSFPLDEYYICVSHSRHRMLNGIRNIKTIIDAINSADEFEITDDIEQIAASSNGESVLNTLFPETDEHLVHTNDSDVIEYLKEKKIKYSDYADKLSELPKCYIFADNPQSNQKKTIWKFDSNFNNYDIMKTFINKKNKEQSPEMQKMLRIPITNVTMITFQIIRLKRRK